MTEPLTAACSPVTVAESPLRCMYVMSATGVVSDVVTVVEAEEAVVVTAVVAEVVVVAGAETVVVAVVDAAVPVVVAEDSMTDSGSADMTFASRRWIARASRAVTPSPRLYTSALSIACAERLNLSLLATNWRIATASATETLLSLLTSPSIVLSAAVSAACTAVVIKGMAPARTAADESTASSFFAFIFFITIKLLIIEIFRMPLHVFFSPDYK